MLIFLDGGHCDEKKKIKTTNPSLERTEELNAIHSCRGAVVQFVCSGSGGATEYTGTVYNRGKGCSGLRARGSR